MAQNEQAKIKGSRRLLDGLKVSFGFFWTVTYLFIIKRGFQDQTFGMPLMALWANIAWEFIFSFIYPHKRTQRIINLIWFVFDVVILWQVLTFGRADPEGRGET